MMNKIKNFFKKEGTDKKTLTFQNVDKYEGGWKDGKKNGKGTMKFENGVIYDGDWKDDKIHGKGTVTFKNGDKYEGEWKDDKMDGKGTWTSKNGYKYDGDWKEGKRHGKGTLTLKNGYKYEGEWKDGKKNGKGTVKFENGDKYEGEWKDNKMDGKGTLTLKNGYKLDGDWKDGYVVASGNNDDKKKEMAILITTKKTDHVAASLTIPLELSKKDLLTKFLDLFKKSLPKVDNTMIENIKNAVKKSQELNILIDVHGDEKGNIEEQEKIKNLITEIATTCKDKNSTKLTLYLGACHGSKFVETQNEFFKEIALKNSLNIKIHHGSEALMSEFYNGKNFITTPNDQGQVVTKTTKFLPSGAVEIGQNTYRSVDDALSRNKSNKIRNGAITDKKPNNKIQPFTFSQLQNKNEQNLGHN